MNYFNDIVQFFHFFTFLLRCSNVHLSCKILTCSSLALRAMVLSLNTIFLTTFFPYLHAALLLCFLQPFHFRIIRHIITTSYFTLSLLPRFADTLNRHCFLLHPFLKIIFLPCLRVFMLRVSILQLFFLLEFLILIAVNSIAQYFLWNHFSPRIRMGEQFKSGLFLSSEEVPRSFSLIVESCYSGQITMLPLFLHLLSSSYHSSHSATLLTSVAIKSLFLTITFTVFQATGIGVYSPRHISSSSSCPLELSGLGDPTVSKAAADFAHRVTEITSTPYTVRLSYNWRVQNRVLFKN